jgi:uncharacterized membrane protein YjjP (DUF1212 family)
VLTAFGALAAVTMVVSYALESRHRNWLAVFAIGCLAASMYAVLSGAWIFAVLETLWAAIAVRRYRKHESVRNDQFV